MSDPLNMKRQEKMPPGWKREHCRNCGSWLSAKCKHKCRPLKMSKTATAFRREIAKRIRSLRQAQGLTLNEAAERAGVSFKTWHRWERAESLTIDSLPKIARAIKADYHRIVPNGRPAK
jgi:DNA-binding XRE family transcriptional regulator